jgi:tripartite-type tricarboxylate transporter receptor subunit TctC
MRLSHRCCLRLAKLSIAIACMAPLALAVHGGKTRAQSGRVIKIVVPLPAGGAADILARILAARIGHDQGVTLVIENRPGAGAIIGTEAVSRAPPDGNTLLLTATGIVISPHLRHVNYDPVASFAPICRLTSTPLVLAVNGASPYRTFADFVVAAHAKPGASTVAGVPATLSQVAFEMLKRDAKLDLTFVPYTGGAPATNDVLGGHVTALLLPYAGLSEQIRSGQLRALASASRNRIDALPDVPTIAESGYPGFDVDFWNGLFAPSKTSEELQARLADWVTAALRAPDVEDKLVAQGFYPAPLCGAEFVALVRKQHNEFGRVIRDSNIRAE